MASLQVLPASKFDFRSSSVIDSESGATHNLTIIESNMVSNGKSASNEKLGNGNSSTNSVSLKSLSLIILALQNAALILVMRYVRTRPGAMFASSTAVIMSEVLKVGSCLAIIFVEQRYCISSWFAHLNDNIFQQPKDCLRISIPAFIYMLQNNLIYVAASNLDAATFQVTYQLKILTTAVLTVIMLRRHLSRLQWFSLVLLFVGVAIVNVEANNAQTSTIKKASVSEEVDQNHILGFAAVLTACVLSGFAGVYFEKILKNTPQSIYVRNVQLGVIGSVLGLGPVFIGDGAKVASNGFFYGYDSAVWSVIMLHAFGGIVVAVVVKYADNILKGFAASAAIIISCVVSVYMFDFEITLTFLFGASLVIIASYTYSLPTKPAVSGHTNGSSDSSSSQHETETGAGLIKIV